MNLNQLQKQLLNDEVFDCIRQNIRTTKLPKTPQLWKQKKKNKKHKNKVKLRKVVFIQPKYKDYIKSKDWKKRRDLYYKTHKKECVVCQSIRKVGLHHISYKHLGREHDDDLVPLCWTCHQDYHEKYGVKQTNEDTNNFIIENKEINEFREILKRIG